MVRARNTPMLESIGISRLEERVYGLVTDAQGSSPGDVAALAGISEEQGRSVLFSLEEKGLVTPSPDNPPLFLPVAPDVALRVLILRRREELERAEMGLEHFMSRFRTSLKERAPTHILELLTGREALVDRYLQMQDASETELLSFDRPPYAMGGDPNETELAALQRGVKYRVLYDPTAFEIPGILEETRRYVEAGEEARSLPGVPMKLTIADRKIALVAISQESPEIPGAVIIYQSTLLDALVMLFELLWERGQPFPGGTARTPEGSDAVDSDLLGLLAAGLKDETAARQLDIGLRTVARRVHGLMEELGARTRFQAGVLAAKRGWLD